MYSAKIRALYEEYCDLIEFCRLHNQVSFEMYINDTYRKTLLLSVASFFETTITKKIHDYAVNKSNDNKALVAFIDNKGIRRQYHTFFDWEKSTNANQFFKLFGDEFKEQARKRIQEKNLEEAERTFISIGQERNRLVHQNFIEVPINDTFEEIYRKYETACCFVEFVVQMLSI